MGDIDGLIIHRSLKLFCYPCHDSITGFCVRGMEAHDFTVNDSLAAALDNYILRALWGFNNFAPCCKRVARP